jgi:hypothetical protein
MCNHGREKLQFLGLSSDEAETGIGNIDAERLIMSALT